MVIMEVALTDVPIPVEAISVHVNVAYEFQREDGASGSGSVDMTVDPNTDAGRPCQGML